MDIFGPTQIVQNNDHGSLLGLGDDDHPQYTTTAEAQAIANAVGAGSSADLTAHLTDPTDAHDASAISVIDVGDYYDSSDLETILQELGDAGGSAMSFEIVQASHAFVVGNVLYNNGTIYAKAQANTAVAAEVVGIVSEIVDSNTFVLTVGGQIPGLSGLTEGSVYYLSATTAGALTATEPTTQGYVSKPILIADSITSGFFFNMRGAVVSAGAEVPASVAVVIDGGGATPPVGVKGYIEVPFDCQIVYARLFADVSGSIVIDIWKDTYAAFPPLDADSITAAAPPTLSSAQKSQNTTLTGWNKTITAGDILAFNVDSASTLTRVTLSLGVMRTA